MKEKNKIIPETEKDSTAKTRSRSILGRKRKKLIEYQLAFGNKRANTPSAQKYLMDLAYGNVKEISAIQKGNYSENDCSVATSITFRNPTKEKDSKQKED